VCKTLRRIIGCEFIVIKGQAECVHVVDLEADKVKIAKSMFMLLKDKVNDASILNAAIGVVSTAWFKGKS
ncbi:hypothetical protein Tco_1330720, partial [Tanacetum coccineum]